MHNSVSFVCVCVCVRERERESEREPVIICNHRAMLGMRARERRPFNRDTIVTHVHVHRCKKHDTATLHPSQGRQKKPNVLTYLRSQRLSNS